MEFAFLVGRILFGGFFALMAFNHLVTAREALAGFAAFKKVPASKLAVALSGWLLLIGGLSMLTGIWPAVGALALVLFFIPVNLTMHDFWTVEDETERMGELTNFMKNMALLGAALMVLAISTPWPLSIAF